MNKIAKRTVSALTVAAIAVCGILWAPFWLVATVLSVLICAAQTEFSELAAKCGETMPKAGFVAALGHVVAVSCGVDPARSALVAVFFLAMAALFGGTRRPISALGTSVLGFVYVPFLLSHLILARAEAGAAGMLFLIAAVKISDMGGFAFGVAFGKHKMCPSVSPNKSWEGLAGSVFASCLVSLCFIPLTRFGVGKALAFGAAAAVIGTLGDLVESRFKREAGVKDSSSHLPAGMGGFLDMFDSLTFAPAILLAYL